MSELSSSKTPTEEWRGEKNEDIYCKALAQTLREVELPMMVGLYSPWGHQKAKLLDKIEGHMQDKPERDAGICSWLLDICSWLVFIWHIIFCCPESNNCRARAFPRRDATRANTDIASPGTRILLSEASSPAIPSIKNVAVQQGDATREKTDVATPETQTLLSEASSPATSRAEEAKRDKNIQHIFINFSAWDYVGCDHIWAGLVTTLLAEIEGKYKYSLGAFRMFGIEFKGKPAEAHWILKRKTKVISTSTIFIFFVFILCGWLLFEQNLLEIVLSIIACAVSLFFAPFISPCKNLYFTMKRKIQKDIKRKDLGAELGFMHSIKREVGTISSFLQVLAFKEKKEFRVVLKVTSLDRCAPEKVVAVLDAMSILLSDRDAPFVSILAVDPSILVECIRKSSNSWSNGYLYLDRIVTLPFSLPQMSHEGKMQLPKQESKGYSEVVADSHRIMSSGPKNGNMQRVVKIALKSPENQDLLHKLRTGSLRESLPANFVQRKRVVNTVFTIYMMITQGYEFKPVMSDGAHESTLGIKEVLDWVILANCWPCRLSWILQCVENNRQQKKLSEISLANSCGKREKEEKVANKLYEIFENQELELGKIKNDIQNLLELDGDPGLFKIFLRKKERHFTAAWARSFSSLLINLDFSLKRRLELLQGLKSIPKSGSDQP